MLETPSIVILLLPLELLKKEKQVPHKADALVQGEDEVGLRSVESQKYSQKLSQYLQNQECNNLKLSLGNESHNQKTKAETMSHEDDAFFELLLSQLDLLNFPF